MNNLLTSILLSVFVAILITENYGYGYWMISRPIFAGPLIGLILGDLPMGLLVGGSVELMFMGILPIGGSVPPNAQIAGIIGTIFAISAKSPELGISLALPIGILAQFLIMLAWNVNIYLIHKADKSIEDGNTKKVEITHLSGLIVFFVIFFLASFLAIYFGSEYVTKINDSLPTWFKDGLKVTSGLLPAIGMAMLLKMMNFKKYWSFFLGGFVLAGYLKLDVLSISLLGLSIATGIFTILKGNDQTAAQPKEDNVSNKQESIITNKELRSTFLRSFFSMTSINYERYTSLGFCYGMIPGLKKLYGNDTEKYKEALLRHNEFFNCHPYTGAAVLGVSLALEEQKVLNKPITAETISSTKTALMGPLSGIGDSIFKATFMTIFAAIGAGMALDGNPLGPIIFIVPNVLLNIGARYVGVYQGYKLGVKLISKMKSSDIIDNFVQSATIVGMMVTGAMIVSFVKIQVAAAWTISGKEIILQDLLNSIFPGLLPLTLTLCFYFIMIKNKNAIYILMGICFFIGIIGKLTGIL